MTLEEKRIELFLAIIPLLPEDERKRIQPGNHKAFISSSLLFRGMSFIKAQELVTTGFTKPEEGEFGSVAVFMTDGPYFAAEFASDSLEAVAVIDPSRLLLLPQGFLVPGSSEYRLAMEQAKQEHPEMDAFEIQNVVDTVCISVCGWPWHTFEARLPQPLAAVCKLLVRTSLGVMVFDPGSPEDLGRLRNLYV